MMLQSFKLCMLKQYSRSKSIKPYIIALNKNGGIIDDLIIYRTDEKEYMLVVNAANIKDWNWLNHQIKKFNCNM